MKRAAPFPVRVYLTGFDPQRVYIARPSYGVYLITNDDGRPVRVDKKNTEPAEEGACLLTSVSAVNS